MPCAPVAVNDMTSSHPPPSRTRISTGGGPDVLKPLVKQVSMFGGISHMLSSNVLALTLGRL